MADERGARIAGGAAANWATRQLAEFLDAVGKATGEQAALIAAAEMASEALGAEIGACMAEAGPLATVGFPPGTAPPEDLQEVALDDRSSFEAAGLGEVQTLAVPVEDERLTRILIGRGPF